MHDHTKVILNIHKWAFIDKNRWSYRFFVCIWDY